MKPYIFLTLLVAIAYANSLQNSFVWDEHGLILENPNIDLPLNKTWSIFISPLWKMTESRQVYYRPMVSLLFVLNYKIWGLNPLGFHLTNILLHLISVIILYSIGLLLFNTDKLISLIGASIFAIHPVNNEPLGRAASGEVIFGFFIILSIYFFLKGKNTFSWILFLLALLSKEASVMMPFALVILATYRKGFKRGIIEIMPYVLVIAMYFILRTMFTDTVLGDKTPQLISTRAFTMLVALLDYIRLLFIPYPLYPFYPARWYTSVFDIKVLFAIIFLISITILIFKVKKDGIMFFLFLFTLIMLAPVIFRVNTFPAGDELVYIAERFLYVSLMPFSLFISAFVVRIFGDEKKRFVVIGWILTITAFTVTTASANRIWKDDVTLFSKILKDTDNATFAHNNLGFAYYKQRQFDDAIREYSALLKLKSNSADIHYNLGLTYQSKGQLEEAVDEYLAALRLKSDYVDAYNNLGNIYYIQGRLDDAVREYLAAIRLNPQDAEAHYNLGHTYKTKGLKEKAKKEFEIVLGLKPGNLEVLMLIEELK